MRRPIPSSQTAGLRPLSTWSVAGAFVLLSLLLASWVWVSDRFFGHASEHPEASFPGSGLLGGWIHFDASWYRSIAEDGYRLVDGQSNVAFFPLTCADQIPATNPSSRNVGRICRFARL